MNNNLPQRKTPRANWIEYNEGMYFITICTKSKKHFFGQIINDVICLSQIGKYLDYVINETPKHQSYIEILQYVIMPNHFHLILNITDYKNGASETAAPYNNETSKFISLLKRYCNREYGENIWQSSCNDHIIRGEKDYQKIWEYIDTNVSRWEKDCFYDD